MKFAMLDSLRGRLVGLLLLVFIPAALLIVAIHLQQRRFIANETGRTAERIVHVILQKERAVMESARTLVVAVARSGQIRKTSPGSCEQYLRELARDQSIFANFGYADSRGNLVCSAIRAPEKLNVGDRSWFSNARELDGFAIGDYENSPINGVRVVAYAYPVRGTRGQFEGVVFTAADFNWLMEMIPELALPAGATVEVVGQEGNVLASYPPRPGSLTGQMPQPETVVAALKGNSRVAVMKVEGSNGGSRIYGFAPLLVAGRNVHVLIGLPGETAFYGLYSPLLENLALLLGLALLAAGGIWLAVDATVLRGVRELIGFSRRLAAGEFFARSGTMRGIRELDQLAEAFDQMASGLERRENERLRAEQALRKSEERFRSIAESSSVGIFRTDPAGRCIYVNQQWCKITGVTPEQAYGDGWLNVLHPLDRLRVSKLWDQAVSRRERFRGEYRFVPPGGREIWVMGEALCENEREGGFVGTITDISERVQAETRLRTSEERFRVFMGNNPAACWIVDEHGHFVYLNRAMAEMLDGTEESLAGQSLFDLFPGELAKGYDHNNRQVLHDGQVMESVERAPRRDGTIGDFATFRFPLRDSDGRDVVGGMAIDVTERTRMADALKVSEERFREFMDNNPALCWISDESGRITYVNKTFERSLQLPLDPVGRHPIELFATSSARQHSHGVRVALEKNQSIETQEQFRRGDGSDGDYTVFRFPLVTADGRRSVGGVAIDTTEKRRAADDLRQANMRLQALSNRVIEVQETERRQIARELHDEIGQCLTALKINLEGLQRVAREPAMVSRIAESVELSAHTLAQVRRLSVDLRPSQLDDLGLDAAVRSILARQASTGKFSAHYDSDLGTASLSDQVETACFRVCQEALTNIIKHANARNVWIKLELRDRKLQLQVRDDGKGFDPKRGKERAIAGESFGLVGMQERAMLAGGQLEIHSGPGQGTEVRAWFSVEEKSMDVRQ